MCKSFLVALAAFLSLSGCGSVRQFLSPFLPSGASDSAASAVITPHFLLEGRAARLQDSLFERLKYLESRPSPSNLSLTSLAFCNRQDSSVSLCATYLDNHRQNSHGLSSEQLRAMERDRILSLRPMWVFARQSKIEVPVVVRSVFKSRDYLFQNSRMVQDTVEVVLPDTVVKARK
ncbi:MAG: hypothetical protein AAB214_06665 [Fibrobacterota bacterium]